MSDYHGFPSPEAYQRAKLAEMEKAQAKVSEPRAPDVPATAGPPLLPSHLRALKPKTLIDRERVGELSDRQLRKQSTDDLLKLASQLEREAIVRHDAAIARANRIYCIAHEVAEERGEHMGRDGI